jgi:uncharacterized protein (DUF58 family)
MKNTLLTPEALDNLKNLTLVAHRVVEGFMAGLHRSPYHGFSVEFAEYRQYMPGDDLRYFEWKTLGKSDRHYIKKFQSETNMRCHLLLDVSGSMGYGSAGVTKLRWAAGLAACLVHLLTHQHDAVGLTLFSDRIQARMPPGAGPRHRHQALALLEAAVPDKRTDIAGALHRIAESINRRSMVVLLSDLLVDPDTVLDGIKHLTFKGHDVVVFQVLDPAERYFDFSGLCEFEDLETGARIQALPEAVGDEVRREVDRFIKTLHQELSAQSIDHREVLTAEPFERSLAHYLHHRMRSS